MRVAVVQFACVPGDIAENTARAVKLIDQAGSDGAELVVLPELADVGYVMPEVGRVAETLSASSFLAGISEAAERAGIVVVSGMAERSGSHIYNSVVVTEGPGSVLASYRKVHLFRPGKEDTVLTPGDCLSVFELRGFRASISVCFDLRFPSMYRTLARRGVELFLIPSAFPFPRLLHWRSLLFARAIENQCYVVAANRVGTDGGTTFCGSSTVIDPYGTVLASLDEISTDIALAKIDQARVGAVRSQLPILEEERLDLYAI